MKIKQKMMLAALEKNLGIVSSACKQAAVSRSMHYKWLQSDENYKNQVEEIENIILDFVESKLYENINKGDVTSSIFFLKTRGQKRGFIEMSKLEVTGKDGRDFIPARILTKEEARGLLTELDEEY